MPHGPFRLGGTEVTPLCDGWAPLPLDDELPGVDVDWDAERERYPWAFPRDDPASWAWHVHAFLVRHPGGVALVDTGIGPFGRPPFAVEGRLEEELTAVGVSPHDVDHVILTHLHADHSGGACRPDGTPRFPNATYHVHPDDWSFFAEHRTPEDFTGRFAMEGLGTTAMLALDPADREVIDGITLVHAPGHTPGHRLVRIDAGGAVLVLTGDLLHVPPQIRLPERPSNHDEDPQLAAAHRSLHLLTARKEGWALGVSHLGRPFGRVTDDGWRSA